MGDALALFMSDSATETIEPDRPRESDRDAKLEPAPGSTDKCALIVGEVWRELKIEAPWLESGDGPHAFIAEDVRTMRKVVVRASPIVESTEWRRGAWERLCALSESQFVRCLSAEEESGWRYEVSALPPAMTLQEWLNWMASR